MRSTPPPDKPPCTGEGAINAQGRRDHCCYQAGRQCEHLVENVDGRRYACGLMVRLGSWEKVNDDPAYAAIGAHWESIGRPFNYCETFDPSFCCRPEFRNGRRYEGHEPEEVGV